MRICFVSSFPPMRGNLSEYGYNIVNSLSKIEKIDEICVISNFLDKIKQKRFSDKILVKYLYKLDNPLTFFRIIWAIRECDCEIVHFNIHMMSWGKGKISNFIGSLIPLLTKLITGKKVVVTLHNIADKEKLKEINRDNLINVVFSWLSMFFLTLNDAITVTLNDFGKRLSKIYPWFRNKILHIPHGFWKGKNLFREDGKFVIFTIGFWRDIKNLPLLLKAFDNLKEKNCELIIAGSSHPNYRGYFEYLKRKYSDLVNNNKIKFYGYIPENRISSIFKRVKLVVLPYKASTGTSGVLHLSLSFGIPVLSSDLRDIIVTAKEENLKILFFRKNNVGDLESELRYLIKNRHLLKYISKHNYSIAKKNTFDEIAIKFYSVYEKLIDEE